jgi:hypothetical protein
VGTPQPADDEHALLLMFAVTHGLARFVDAPEGRADVDLVAREWDRPPTCRGIVSSLRSAARPPWPAI